MKTVIRDSHGSHSKSLLVRNKKPSEQCLRLPSRRQVVCAEPELDGCCYYPTGRGLRLPSRRQMVCTEPELDCCCCYPAGRGPRLPSRRQVACAEPELDGCCYYPAGRGLLPHHISCRRLRAWPRGGGGGARGNAWNLLLCISSDFPLDLTDFSWGSSGALNPFFSQQDAGISNFRSTLLQIVALNKSTSSFKSPISRIRKLQQTLNPNPKKKLSFENPKP